jgi:hypothetical protein
MNRPKILFLPGVFLKDCPCPDDSSSEEVVEVQLSSDDELDSITTDISQLGSNTKFKSVIKKYDTIPRQFITRDKWPKHTNLLCWYCDCAFTGIPWPVIISCSKTLLSGESDTSDISDTSLLNSVLAFNEVLVMDTYGNFCQAGCSMAYVDTVRDPNIINKHESKGLLLIFIEKVTGVCVAHVPCSDPKISMKKYSGPYGKTEDKYQEDNRQKSAKYIAAIEKSSLSAVTVKPNIPERKK